MPGRVDDPDPEPRERLFEHGPKAERTGEPDSPPAAREGGPGIPARLADALAGLAPERVRDLADAVVLHKMFPAWAVWLPEGSRPWTAARPAAGSAPGPGLPMIWIGRNTAADLAARMRDVDAQQPLGGDREHPPRDLWS